ncbi:MAG: glycyl-radical enzyme activating protein [Eubacteriales bacterium]|nr:glycyl-radical enzyme activating protein [Eubacteriales bacterium]
MKRFATHDGSGLRTTVFLKGCPLRCVWCQNPEGLEPEPAPVYFPNKCIGCGACLKTSINGGVTAEKSGIRIHRNRKDNWEAIIYNCPAGAILMNARIYTVQELIKEILKDKVFYCRGGGGVTLSGGEPLVQADFAAELLKELKRLRIHTAMETSLSVPLEALKKVLPFLDQLYADMKVADAEEHTACTGASNGQICKNMEYLLRSAQRDMVIVRTPLIPYYTATRQNLAAIAEFLSGIFPEVSYELLNYNPLAEAKYRLVDKTYCFQENPGLYTRKQMQEFGSIVREHGIRNLIMEDEA